MYWKQQDRETILDIFGTNDHDLVSYVRVEDTDNRTSDHKILFIQTNIIKTKCPVNCPTVEENILSTLNYWSPKSDWTSLRAELAQYQWQEIFQMDDISEIFERLVGVLTDICAKYVPPKVCKKRSLIPRERRILMRRRKKLRSKLLSNVRLQQLSNIEESLIQIENDLINSHEAERAQKENQAIEKIHVNPKFFFNYARSNAHVKSPIGPLQHNNSTIIDPKATSEILKTQFESVFSTPLDTVNIENLLLDHGPRSLEDIDFTEDDIERAIMSISPTSSPGQDGVTALLLRNCAPELKQPIYLLWRASLDTGRLPKSVKTSIVIPVFKSGSRCSAENYRPISLTSHICKIFERIIVKAMTAYLNEADLFNKGQHGFRSGRSCVSQLLEHHQEILNALERNVAVDVVYLDFSKAFDRVDYHILLQKLKIIGITGKLLRWLFDFIYERRQRVRVEGHLSSEGSVLSGVPQGSSLGPLLFLILISDIDQDLNHVSVTSFADDTRFLLNIEDELDCAKMQDDLISVYQWAESNNMKFNSKKFELISYSAHSRDLNKLNLNSSFNFPQYYDRDGNIISSVETVRDLGVMMDSNANFESQIEVALKKGSQLAGWVLRVFRTRERCAMLTLFRAMVLPHLEYCCQLWSPVALGKVRRLEAVQRSFTVKINGMSNLSYWERLKSLGIYSLERRRERYLIIYIYKIINNVVPNFQSDKFGIKLTVNDRHGRTCIIPPINTRALASVSSLVESSFPIRGPRLFNALPANVRNYDGSVDAFKARLDKFLAIVPDQPCTPNYHQPSASNSILDQLAALRAAGVYL